MSLDFRVTLQCYVRERNVSGNYAETTNRKKKKKKGDTAIIIKKKKKPDIRRYIVINCYGRRCTSTVLS